MEASAQQPTTARFADNCRIHLKAPASAGYVPLQTWWDRFPLSRSLAMRPLSKLPQPWGRPAKKAFPPVDGTRRIAVVNKSRIHDPLALAQRFDIVCSVALTRCYPGIDISSAEAIIDGIGDW
jgi:hypothetical protein